ncbi:hypothetical protein E4198_10645 [Streptomyces sp. RKND-216]|uniref:hypothetical protein n=1 Tax=Streptomyces sp. RKND-216 TaxID=2562581 RepID=UPI00109DD0A9|nr:hypothetical protein [Streptomyces sp. RKND-216]THA25125.1 hypothetical protein E4198_10645 [Streptomyces sp. RKND-216]
MTALPRGLRPRGLGWSVLTTHRLVAGIYLGAVVVAAALLVSLHYYGSDVLAAAAEHCEGTSRLCERDVDPEQRYRYLMGLAHGSLALLPLVVAAFAGAALVGREMENGTAALAWTQSVSPLRWLAAKLTFSALLLVTGTVALTLLIRFAGLPDLAAEWHDNNPYLATGPTGTAYALLALATGAVAGLLLRRTLPALAAAVGATGLTLILGAVYRVHLWPKVLLTATPPRLLQIPSRSQIIDSGGITPSGERFSHERCAAIYRPDFDRNECLRQYDADAFATVHPPSHYWPLQLVETGIVLGLAAGLTAAAFWLLRRRLP